jgi:tRNA A-37 threonylcarbamoyl transferase component Bud32
MRWVKRVLEGSLPRRGAGGLQWRIDKSTALWLPPALLDNPETFLVENPPKKFLKESAVRTASIISGPRGEIFLKHYKMRSFAERWKYVVFSSKARREWHMAHQALRKGILTPFLLAMAERRKGLLLRDAFLIAQAIIPSAPLIELIPRGEYQWLLLEAADLIRRSHEAGLFHQDLHAGNILVGMKKKKLYLIDLHRAKFVRAVSRRRRIWNLAQFFYSLKPWLTPDDKKAFLERYDESAPVFAGGFEQGLQEIEVQEEYIQRRHMRSRTKRCLKESGGFSVMGEQDWQIWCRRGWKPQGLLKIVARHRAIVTKKKEGLIKTDRRTAITLFNYNETRVCVKEYRYQGVWQRLKETVRMAKARRGWVMGNGLVVHGIGGIIPQALLERRRSGLLREAFLIMETPPGYTELDRYIMRSFEARPRDDVRRQTFLNAFAVFMAKLYLRRITHKDLKTCNIMVREREDTWDFGLVDMDDVRLDKTISGGRLVKGLIQLNTSTPLCLDMRDRRGFLARYLQLIKVDNIGHIIQGVISGSTGRQLVYVTPGGDVSRDVDWEGACKRSSRSPLCKEVL